MSTMKFISGKITDLTQVNSIVVIEFSKSLKNNK